LAIRRSCSGYIIRFDKSAVDNGCVAIDGFGDRKMIIERPANVGVRENLLPLGSNLSR